MEGRYALSAVVPSTPEDNAKQFVGSILIDPDLLPQYRNLVTPQDMPTSHLRAIYEEALRLYGCEEPLPIAICRELRGSQLFKGNYPAGYALAEIGQSVCTVAHVDYFARRVKESANAQRLDGMIADARRDLKGKPYSEVFANLDSSLELLRHSASPTTDGSEELFQDFRDGVLSREKPAVFDVAPIDSALNTIPMGEGLVTMFGAPPAEGKTALVTQLVFDAMRLPGQQHLKILFANVEMSPKAILNRQLARLSGVGHTYIQHRDYDSAARPRLEAALDTLATIMPRVRFMGPPFTLDHLAEEAASFESNVVVIDYVQRFTSEGEGDIRAQTNATMDVCRRIADEGRAVIAVSAVSRQKGNAGSTYKSDTMGLASFRESSELEYGCDSAWILARKEHGSKEASLRCVKNRHGSMRSIDLMFDGSKQQFTEVAPKVEWEP